MFCQFPGPSSTGLIVAASQVINQLDLAHQRTDANCIHQKENSPKRINHHLTLKEEPKVKSDHIKRFLAHDFLQVGVTLQTSRNTSEI